jgi:hypothetical protein
MPEIEEAPLKCRYLRASLSKSPDNQLPNNQLTFEEKSTLEARVDLFGLNPRYVFGETLTLQKKIESVIAAALSLDQLKIMLGMMNDGANKVQSGDIKGILADVIPPYYDEEDDYYELPPVPTHFRFASDKIASLIVRRLNALLLRTPFWQ